MRTPKPSTPTLLLFVAILLVVAACAPDPEAMCKDVIVHAAILATRERLPADAPREAFERTVLESAQALASEFGDRCMSSVTPELHRCYLEATSTAAARNCRGLAVPRQSPTDLVK